jgi:hypothetical protein
MARGAAAAAKGGTKKKGSVIFVIDCTKPVGQDHGHRVAGEVPAGAHQGRRRQGREPWRLHHRLPREDQGHRHLRGALLEEVCDSHLPKPVLIVVMNNA